MSVDRVSNLSVQPSGKFLTYVITKHDHISNKISHKTMLANITTGEAQELDIDLEHNGDISWSPDGRSLAAVSEREEGTQVWIVPFERKGEIKRISNGAGGASHPVWSPDGSRIAFARSVVVSPYSKDHDETSLEQGWNENARIYGLVNPKSSARVESSLLFRHWNRWRLMRRKHLFIVDVTTGEMKDITPGDVDVPPISLGGSKDYSFSPDGNEISYVMNTDRIVTRSTNNSIFVQKLNGVETEGPARKISDTNAMEIEPRYSHDGRYISYLGATVPGYEADRLRIKVYDRKTGETRILTEDFDRSARNPFWSENDNKIYFLAPNRGLSCLYYVDVESGKVSQLLDGSFISNINKAPEEGVIATMESATHPADVYIIQAGKGEEHDSNIRKISAHGDWLSKERDMYPLEEIWFKGADGDDVHGYLLKPPNFDPDKQYPSILAIHGGPQGAFTDSFNYRLNPHVIASQGYVVLMFNPRGSIGFGQKFTDQVSGDWGGRCYEDVMKGLDYCINEFDFIDRDRLSAIGLSFGGFLVNWMAGHTNRFKALVSHAGTFNAETRAYTTDELWFLEWESGGFPHEDHENALKFSPHMFIENIKTPMLVIQGEQDFRCPVSQGIGLFSALQVLNVPSKLLYFPDEGHSVRKPANVHVWFSTIMDFIKENIE